MSVRQHLLATLLLCLAITLGTTFALHLQQRHEAATLTANFTRERQEQLEEAVREQSEALGVFVQDYSGWDDMVSFAGNLNAEWASLNIQEVMERYRLSAVWLVAPDGRVLYSCFAEGEEPVPAPPGIREIVASRDWSRETGGFYRADGKVVDLRARPVQPTADIERKSKPAAWLLAGRVLDQRFAERMEKKLQARVTLVATSEAPPRAEEPEIIVRHPLPGFAGSGAVAEWQATFGADSLELGEHYNDREMFVWLCAVVLLLGVVGWSVTRNVLRPLSHIGASLERDSPEPLAGISKNLPEFTRIAELIRDSFRQREALRREIDERARLGRDLHDGVIQNLYATGMGIAHGMRMVSGDPEKARLRLEETLRTLNETMESLRGFIARAEPESAGEVDFADSCVTLFQTLRVHRDCQLDLDISSAADAAIPAGQKANVLFIVREAISNALRHGGAKNIVVSLQPVGDGWALSVRDDGHGHDFSASDKGGRGLENIRARARDLGGVPCFAPAPGGGVEVVVEWHRA
jgi:signal transduction histidine kinase